MRRTKEHWQDEKYYYIEMPVQFWFLDRCDKRGCDKRDVVTKNRGIKKGPINVWRPYNLRANLQGLLCLSQKSVVLRLGCQFNIFISQVGSEIGLDLILWPPQRTFRAIFYLFYQIVKLWIWHCTLHISIRHCQRRYEGRTFRTDPRGSSQYGDSGHDICQRYAVSCWRFKHGDWRC